MKSEKYSALKIIIIIQKILGVIAIIAGAFAISSFFEGGGAEVFLGGIGVIFLGIIFISVGELFKLLVDIEKNTRVNS